MTETLNSGAVEALAPFSPPLPRGRGLPLHWRLILLVVAGVVPLLAFCCGSQYFEYRADTLIDRQRLLALARSMAEVIDGALGMRVVALQTAATAETLQNGDFARFRTQSEEILRRQFRGAVIELVDKDGQEIVNTARPAAAPVLRRSNLESLHRVFATGQPAVSDVYRGADGRRPVISIDVPVKDAGGQVRYVLGLHPPLGVFADVVRRQQLPPGWVLVVTDRRGTVVARAPGEGAAVGLGASRGLLGPLRTQDEGIVNVTSPDGVRLGWAFAHDGPFGWAVALGVPRPQLTARARSEALATLAAGSAILAISLLLAIIAARRIVGPIGTLRRLAAASDDEAWVTPEPTGVLEVDEVAAALFVAEDERRRSRRAETLLRDGIDSIPEGFALYDAQDRLVMCNDNYRRLFPSSPAAIVAGARFEELVRGGLGSGYAVAPARDEEAWVAAQVGDHLNPQAATEQHLANGRWVLVRNCRLSNGGTAGLRIDITSLKTAQEALRTSEERFRSIFDSISEGIFIASQDGIFTGVNAAVYEMFGYAPGELIGADIETISSGVPPYTQTGAMELNRKLLSSGRPQRFDWHCKAKDGHLFWGEVALRSASISGEDVVLAMLRDVTERRAIEDQLRHTQRLAQLGSDVRNLQTDEAVWSDETYRIFGVTRDRFVPSTANVVNMVHPEDRPLILDIKERIMRGDCTATCEFRIVRPDGVTRHLYCENEIVNDAAGKPFMLVATVQDITERRRTEEQLRQSQKMEAIGNLTGGMAHDFNNLLGIIVGNLDVARERIGDNEELREIVGEALDAAWRGADLTRRLLAFARRQPLRPARVDVNELIGDAVRLLRRLLGEDIEVTLELGAEVWPVVVDPAQLEASLANLATNARDAMPKGGRLIIATANRQLDADYVATHPDAMVGDFAMVEVSDTGCGMTREVQRQIFEPFFTTKDIGKGTGLGLSMVFGFLRQSAGHVNVYSEPGVGTTFRLYLPRSADTGAARDTGYAQPLPRGAGQRVLVVEDNSGVRRVVARQLRDLGYRVVECDGPSAALDVLQSERIDLLFTDIVMPGGLDGVELARLARERWPALKVVLTSGFPQSRLDRESAAGDIALLSKPYRKEDLAAALRVALDG
jgi:PAS domain S-box-containing protein